MSDAKFTRKQFLCSTSLLATAAVLPGAPSPAAECAQGSATKDDGSCGTRPISVRPYQLLCLICSQGDASPSAAGKLPALREAIRRDPDVPLAIRCNAGDVYVYQDPALADDTPEGRDFNRKRDLDILQRMGWEPAVILPARTALRSLHKHIKTVAGICGYNRVTSPAWKGCARAASGNYEKGHKMGLAALIPPRTETEMVAEKRKSMESIKATKEVTTRPHILLCAVCQYGGGLRPPYKADNLPELLEIIVEGKSDLKIKMARQADWMMCAPCPNRAPNRNACVNVLGSGGLSNEKRDLDMLQILGLQFGDSRNARELFRLIFEKIPSTQAVCKRENDSPSVWWDGCGESNREKGNANYEKGRRELMAKLGL